jgi:putative oxidoreductase
VPQLQGWGIAILRIVTATIFLMGGVEKLFIEGPHNTVGLLVGLGSPSPLAVAISVALIELLCGLALLVGIFTRCVSILLALGMLVNILLIHGSNGFFIHNGGYEYALLRLADCVALILAGPGRVALDNALTRRKRTRFPRLSY